MRECRAKPHCVLCEGKGRNSEHRSGSNVCEILRDFNQRNQNKQTGQSDQRTGKGGMEVDDDQNTAV